MTSNRQQPAPMVPEGTSRKRPLPTAGPARSRPGAPGWVKRAGVVALAALTSFALVTTEGVSLPAPAVAQPAPRGPGSPDAIVVARDASSVTNSPGTKAVGLQFSPETVIVPAATGAATLRSVSPDASIYTFSARTGVLARVKAGSVMLLQGLAVRVVTSAVAQGAGLVVTTTPASITDLIANGTLSWDTPVDFADALALQGPAVPDENAALAAVTASKSVPAPLSTPLPAQASRLGFAALGGHGVTLKGKAGTYDYSIAFKQAGSALSMTITLSKSSPVEVSATVSGTLDNLTTAGGITVHQGHLGSAKVQMNNLNGQFTLSYELKPLTAFGLGSAGGFKLTLPGEVTVPFTIGGIPFFLGVKVAFYVAVGFSNKSQSIKGSYTVNYNGNAGFSTSASGATSALGAVKGIGKVILDQANAILSGPISLVLGAQIPQLELGLGVKGLSVAGFVDLVADTAIKVGGGTPGLGPSTGGCDARDLKVLATAGAKASFFGLSASLGLTTLFSKDFIASYPPGCGTVGG